ncbi:hypothetical protein GCM10022403_035320 [Streptomyces coacervatus]|uniref:SpdD-like protein n=1 Tax=Streptomyces coacervatus TaxID=647381 RepID=A0ABP7HP38_9ACTN|nr:hypothetical protein [Streptomyces coacervatus]MDF2272000.1 hypothetical protein [Streptomyces coacervatus]
MTNSNEPSSSSPTGTGPFFLVDGRLVPCTPTQDAPGVPAGSTFSASSAVPPGPFIVNGALQPSEPALPAAAVSVPVPGSAPLVVHGIVLPPPSEDTASTPANGTPNTVSWPSVAITAIVAAVVVTCMVLGKSTEATVTGVLLVGLLANHVRTSLGS